MYCWLFAPGALYGFGGPCWLKYWQFHLFQAKMTAIPNLPRSHSTRSTVQIYYSVIYSGGRCIVAFEGKRDLISRSRFDFTDYKDELGIEQSNPIFWSNTARHFVLLVIWLKSVLDFLEKVKFLHYQNWNNVNKTIWLCMEIKVICRLCCVKWKWQTEFLEASKWF